MKNAFFIETYGCAFNKSDSQKMKFLLIENGYTPSDLKSAEFIIVNTCGVKSQTEAKILFRIKKIPLSESQKLIIAGCLPWISKNIYDTIIASNSKIIGVLDVHSCEKIIELIDNHQKAQILRGYNPLQINNKEFIKPWIDDSNEPGIVQIAEGCNGTCTYCCTKNARGTLHSFSSESILDQIKYYINNGTKQIFITAQDVGSYKYKNHHLIDLLRLIKDSFQNNEDIVFRLGMLNPEYLIGNIQKILKILEERLFFNFLHIPIQSASDKILKLMERKYLSSHIDKIFYEIRNNSNFTLSTDIICGFPEESAIDFEKSLKFVEKFKPDILNISKFTTRPNTKAKNMKPIDTRIIKARTQNLTNFYKSYMIDKNKKFLNWRGKVMITEYRADKRYPYFGRNFMYKPVVLKQGELNKTVNVEIIKTHFNYLIGRVI